MGEAKKIYCPRCGCYLMAYDGRAQNNLSMRCRTCDRLVTYFSQKDEIQIGPMPDRQLASGTRFY